MTKPEKQERIIYVEPNDVYDSDVADAQGDLSLTPKYEDFCISFNLIIEQFSRFKPDGVAPDANGRTDADGNKRTYVIQWGLTQKDMMKKRTSVLQGNRGDGYINVEDGTMNYPYGDKYNYLTTYFTDLTYDSYGEKTQIEGLGVENVQISYESWYTPTVTIKFVDVRGSAIFGREEAIHIDSQLMAENVFGAFFSMPYPLFRLQVKGFFGKPVTYQLACSSFKGEFNSQTGNFEAVATFIGYSWSLLTDIPFAYLVAAPYATYIGNDYWNRKKGSKEWELWNNTNGIVGIQPPKLYDLFKAIKNVIKTSDFDRPDEAQSQELSQMGDEKALMNEIKSKYSKFLSALKGLVDTNCFLEQIDEETHNTQLLLFSSSDNVVLSDELKTRADEYYDALLSYQMKEFKNGCDITTAKMANNWTKSEEDESESLNIPSSLAFKDTFVINVDSSVNNNVTSISVKEIPQNLNVELLQGIDFNGHKLSKTLANTLLSAINDNKRNIKQYCYLIDLYDIPQQIADRDKTMINRENKITEEINERANRSIISLLGGINNGGFKPFIGNVFKIIFCHLETFCHIMFDSAKEIYAQMDTGKRDPSQLGIDMKNTDINPEFKKNISPWPAMYNNGVETSECGYKSNTANVYGWPGDIPSGHSFIEEKVVYALQEGIQMIAATGDGNIDKVKRYTAFPVLPSDYINGDVFSSVTISNKPDLAGHLANRIASIIGVLCGNNIDDDMADTFGRLDAYNLYASCGSIVTYENAVKDIEVDQLVGIMYCDPKYDEEALNVKEGDDNVRKFDFENARKISDKFAKPINGTMSRHPFFKDIDGNNALYIHFYDNNEINYIPSKIKPFGMYKSSDEKGSNGDFIYKLSSSEQYFIPNITKSTVNNTETVTNANDWLHICDSTKIQTLKDNNIDFEKYTNKQMFNVITDASAVNGIKKKCDELLSGNVKLMEYDVNDDFSKFVDKFLGASNNFYSQWFKNVLHMLSGNALTLFNDKTHFLQNSYDYIPSAWNWEWWASDNGIKNSVEISDECDFLYNGEKKSLSDLAIQSIEVNYLADYCCIFGCPLYYSQVIKDDKEKDDTNNLYEKRVLKSKAYLFVNCFYYGDKKISTFNTDKKNGFVQLVPKAYLLKIGAMLWRRRYFKKYGYDPIHTLKLNYGNGYFDIYNPGVEYTFILKKNEDFRIYSESYTDKKEYYTVNDFVGGDIDYNYENQLIELFEDFTDKVFVNIASKYELKFNDKLNDGSDMENFTNKYLDLVYAKEKNPTEYTSAKFIEFLKNSGVQNLLGNYSGIAVLPKKERHKQGLKMLFNEDNKDDQQLFKDLYFGSYAVMDNCYKLLGKQVGSINNSDKIYVNKSLLQSYLKGFVKASSDILASETIMIGGDTNLNVSTNTFKNRDLSLAIYYYLKNLWDKWLVVAETDAFDVKKFFDENFVFIDSFYNNVYNKLAINCEMLLNAWTELADNGSLFHFLSQIVSKHGCIFLPVPDYISFNGDTDDDSHDIEMMKDLFRPIPYNAMDAPSNNNKFIVMYTHSPSHVKSDQNAYVKDSYDIWSHADGRITKEASDRFKINTEKQGGSVTRNGYNVPCFGIAFAKQNNHIFKNLRLTMDNPVMTEQAIKAQWQIAITGGSSEAHSIHFIGQDTFNVFSNYSYSITVDMMGNAQICPLMYFQLLNVPLWRGTYMIYKVTHNMTPGDMTTTITAMKMSKFAQPFNSNFFTIHKIKKAEQNNDALNSNCDEDTYYGGVSPSISGGKITNAPNVNVKDDGAYNLVLWRYNVSKETFHHSKKQGNTGSSHSIEGVIYEEKSKKILTWTIQASGFDRIGGKKEYYNVVPSVGGWETEGGKDGYHYGCSSYCASLTKGGGHGFSGQAGVSGSMLRIEASDWQNSGGCLFHPGQNAGSGWTTGCILCGKRAVNGNRSGFTTDDYHADKIFKTNNEDVSWWKNFYYEVCPKICSGQKVHLYVSNERKNVAYDAAVIETGGTPKSNPTGNLVDIKASLPDDLKPYVIINPIYATTTNFGGRVMPGYKQGQKYLWIGKETMKMFIKSVRYMRSKTEYQNYKLMIWDAYRPYEAADNFCKIAPKKYVVGGFIAKCDGEHSKSPHCVGKAIDLTLTDSSGKPLPMFDLSKASCSWARETGGFDEFSDLGKSKPTQKYQKILRDIMMIFDKNGKRTNFKDYSGEFWHFTSSYNEVDGSRNYT